MKNGLRGCLGSCAMMLALRVMALLLSSEKLRVGRPIVLEALCMMCMSLFLLEATQKVVICQCHGHGLFLLPHWGQQKIIVAS